MAKSVQERSAKTARRRVAAAEEELRLRVRPGTRQAMTLMIHHLHALGSAKCQPLLNPPRHEIEISQNVAREFRNKSLLAIQKDPGDEIIEPLSP